MTKRLTLAVVVASALALSACSGDDGLGDLSERAQQGKAFADQNGCGSCHGGGYDGNIGPSWRGLYGSEVTLDDGTVVVADREYLARSITEPEAEQVEGYAVTMPTNRLEDNEIEAIIDFIKELQ